METIYDAAIDFEKLMGYEYNLVFGYKGKSVDIPIRFDVNDFHHLCGLHKLKDLSYVSSSRNSVNIFNDILSGDISNNDLEQSPYFIKEELADRIKRVCQLSDMLDNHLADKTSSVFKYNNNANPESTIPGNFLIKCQAKDHRYVYLTLMYDSAHIGKYFGLSIFSRDLSDKKQKDFALGHTFNTLLYVSKTPLINGEPDRSKEEVLFKRSSYNGANNGNVTIVKFSQINNIGGDVAVLAPPRFSFRQALAKLINKWADKIGEGIERRKRELQIAKQENNELKKELTERDEQLAQKDETINELRMQKKDLTLELIEQKRLFREATRKTLDEKFAEAKQRCRDRKTEKPPHLPEPPKGTHRR